MKKIFLTLALSLIGLIGFSQKLDVVYKLNRMATYASKTDSVAKNVAGSALFYLKNDISYLDLQYSDRKLTFHPTQDGGSHQHSDGGYGTVWMIEDVADKSSYILELLFDASDNLKLIAFKDPTSGVVSQFYVAGDIDKSIQQ